MADYHHPTQSHSLLHHLPYPNPTERLNFYHAYLDELHQVPSPLPASVPLSTFYRTGEREEGARRLEEEVRVWTGASHAMWAVWGVVQARDHVEGVVARWALKAGLIGGEGGEETEEVDTEMEFDYPRYVAWPR